MRNNCTGDQLKVLKYVDNLLVGPRDGENEVLFDRDINPIDLYLMGMIHPLNNEEENEVLNYDEDVQFQLKPSSLGISFYLEGNETFECNISCGQYVEKEALDISTLRELSMIVKNDKDKTKEEILLLEKANNIHLNAVEESDIKKLFIKYMKNSNDSITNKAWVRKPLKKLNCLISRTKENKEDIFLFNKKVRINITWRKHLNGYLVTVTMINNIKERIHYITDQLFQCNIEILAKQNNIKSYPTNHNLSYDNEEEELALIYRNEKTYAIGHSCAAKWDLDDNSNIKTISTEFLPHSTVKKVTTTLEKVDNSKVLSLQYLCSDKLTREDLKSSLDLFVDDYKDWINKQDKINLDDTLKSAKKRIIDDLDLTLNRMKKGIDTIINNLSVFETFKFANKAMLMQMVHGGEISKINENYDEVFQRPEYLSSKFNEYCWRPFQLAFFLLTIESVINENSDDRNVVDLIWFPTGGGKTEAYLAVAAFELFYRRVAFGNKGNGTSIIKRYTLRLLTAQQFQRASGLICACEILRRESSGKFGEEEFSLGLWVGGESSPNKYVSDDGSGSHNLYLKTIEEEIPENRFQVQKCPWCGTRIIPKVQKEEASYYGIKSTQNSFSFYCPRKSCDFSEKLPINVVDQELYKKAPSFVIGTVDKFARLAWDNQASIFFGVNQNCNPPSLIIQDELHLISGPLGTIAGLYESAIDTVLSSLNARPKIIAATATIRRANDQIQGLFAAKTNIFPPKGINYDDSYFARLDNESAGRLYIGVMSQSGTQTSAIVDVGTVLSQAPIDLELTTKVKNNAKDAYWTQVIYHSSKKELAKTNSLAEDDIPNRLKFIVKDQSKMRKIVRVEELSGDKKGNEMTSILEQMELDFENNALDILPCTNVISVGVDVSRLGLIVMHGQPKTTSEYIQASSRVGRGDVPGIVLTVYPSHNPRNRSHYENFIPYHNMLYRYVEPTSVTPYAAPARDRALHAALVVVMRFAGGIGEDNDAGKFEYKKAEISSLVDSLIERMIKADPSEEEGIRKEMFEKISEWEEKVTLSKGKLSYRKKTKYPGLLTNFENKKQNAWQTLNSMRGVDAEINIVINGEKR